MGLLLQIDRRLVDRLASIASTAAAAILNIGPADVSRRDKADGSPVTAADEASEAAIVRVLQGEFPDVPVVSEESSSRLLRRAKTFFLVDPLDGTNEYLAGLDEYTVNIALIEDGRPVAGVIAAPTLGTVWTGLASACAERLALAPGASIEAATQRTAIRTRPRPSSGAVALVSRSHREAETDAYLDRFAGVERAICGSSLKFCRIAEANADLYVRMASISEWDVAAGHAILEAAGGAVRDTNGRPLTYAGASERLPHFIASGDVNAPT